MKRGTCGPPPPVPDWRAGVDIVVKTAAALAAPPLQVVVTAGDGASTASTSEPAVPLWDRLQQRSRSRQGAPSSSMCVEMLLTMVVWMVGGGK